MTFPGDVEIQQLAHHCEGNHFLALAWNREVYSWGEGESGQLGLGDTKYVTLRESLRMPDGWCSVGQSISRH